MQKMRKKVELPISEPIYGTYHYQGSLGAVIYSNPSIRNWYLNEIFILECNTKFLKGYSSPEISVEGSSWYHCPHLERLFHSLKFAKGYINPIIRELINNGYYVGFSGVDDYYLEGKSWYGKRHFNHDGLIFGYDQDEKTYNIFAYDSSWVYTSFKTSQKAFNMGCISAEKTGESGHVCGIKATDGIIYFDPYIVKDKMVEYLSLSVKKPSQDNNMVSGIAVHDYIAIYIDLLTEGTITYDRIDRRVFRLIWEHKKLMYERIVTVEKHLLLNHTLSNSYADILSESDAIRMLYASHCIKRRDSILPLIKDKLITLRKKEECVLDSLVKKMEQELR